MTHPVNIPPAQIPPPPDLGNPDDNEPLFDWKVIKNWVGFVANSVRRHKLLFSVVFGVVAALVVVAAIYMPRKYKSQSKLLAQKNQMMAALGNPYRRVDWDPEGPTRAAYETVMARENLINMIKQTNLIERFNATRNPLLKAKDFITHKLAGEWDAEVEMESMVGMLEKRLTVETGDGTVSITVLWPEPQMARQLVDTAQQSFLEARHVSEVSAISEAISILESHLSEAEEQIDAAITEVRRVVDERRKAGAPPPKVKAPPRMSTPRAPKSMLDKSGASPQEIAQVKFMIASKKRALGDLEEFRNRRLTELQGQLAEQKVIYAANHPVIVDIEQRIQSLNQESPQASALKRDVEALENELNQMSPKEIKMPGEPGTSVKQAIVEVSQTLQQIDPNIADDPSVMVSRDQLRLAVSRYQDLQMRLDAARIELDTARAAFKYRYSVVDPALTPRKAEGLPVAAIILAGLLLAGLLAVSASFIYDFARRRALEAWQVEQQLDLPVLAELKF